MPIGKQYALLDFGDGRKLERFGSVIVDRPEPLAEGSPQREPRLWTQAAARFERIDAQRGRWNVAAESSLQPDASSSWTILCEGFSLGLRLTPSGQVGIFPEQQANWDWIAAQVRAIHAAGEAGVDSSEPAERMREAPRVLNLFAYTGASTLVAASAGAAVTHVDAAQSVVRWARENAAASGLQSAPIRWIVDDARQFVARELRRGRTYDGVILDPPSYGHGPGNEPWLIEKHLPALLLDCARLTAQERGFMLVSCHTPSMTPKLLREMLEDVSSEVLPQDLPAKTECGRLELTTTAQRQLSCGVYARRASHATSVARGDTGRHRASSG